METLYWVLAAIAVIGLIVYYLMSQKKISVPGISKEEEKTVPPPQAEESEAEIVE